ncbi:hypothetical protein K461DRAFT_320420 [Myriangium duriaei CBS 260.36]|uniref:Uncharacterized protein n=1 Tax=Myriangium duriaei CBS 260.36 TaxID=1168546 RepID=A0A9P4J2H9_9PEZI|nr:hypothetical protein K461DRAFT_320420 [Myriangium duriaei CBS 260.36]
MPPSRSNLPFTRPYSAPPYKPSGQFEPDPKPVGRRQTSNQSHGGWYRIYREREQTYHPQSQTHSPGVPLHQANNYSNLSQQASCTHQQVLNQGLGHVILVPQQQGWNRRQHAFYRTDEAFHQGEETPRHLDDNLRQREQVLRRQEERSATKRIPFMSERKLLVGKRKLSTSESKSYSITEGTRNGFNQWLKTGQAP